MVVTTEHGFSKTEAIATASALDSRLERILGGIEGGVVWKRSKKTSWREAVVRVGWRQFEKHTDTRHYLMLTIEGDEFFHGQFETRESIEAALHAIRVKVEQRESLETILKFVRAF